MTSSIVTIKSHEGKCSSIAFDEISNNVITVGVDGTVNIWSARTNNLIKNFNVSDNVNSMVYEKERIFIASSLNIIESYCTNNQENIAVIAQFLSEVNHMRISKDKSCFVAGSSDNTAKVIQRSLNDDQESREIILSGHEGPVISTDIDADCTLVATASCDGYVIIWRARDGAQITKLPILDKIKDISQANNICRLRFSPSSDPILAVPLSDEISLLDCDDWSVRGSLKWSNISNKAITECIFTDDGNFLAAGTMDGHILVWNISNLTLVNSWSTNRGSGITGMLWFPKKEKTLLLTDASGYWEAIKLDLKKKEKDPDALSIEELEDMFGDFTEEDNDNADMDKDVVKDVDDVDDVDLNEDIDDVDLDKESLASTVKRESDDDSNNPDEFNLSMIKAEFEKNDNTNTAAATVPIMPSMVTKKISHPPVIPGFTPISDGMQLLLWNSVGALKKHYDEDGNANSLEAYFHDCNLYRSIIVKPEIIDCDMGDMNTFALLLVSDQDPDLDDDEQVIKPGSVYVQSVSGSWPSWKMSLPRDESPVGCCLAGDEYAIVLSDNGLLRYFSLAISGMEMFVESVQGTPVAIVSDSYDSDREVRRPPQVVVVVENEGRLMWRLEELRPGHLIVERGRMTGSVASDWHPLPLSADARLTWIGFSDGGVLYTVDSRQCVRRMIMSQDKGRFSVPRWTPVLDLKKVIDKKDRAVDRYFPVGFSDCGENTGATVLKCLGSRFPVLVPWPHLSVVSFSMSRCSDQTEAGRVLETSLVMHHLMPQDDQDQDREQIMIKSEKKLLLELFLNALTQNCDHRAMAIARLMPDSSLVQIAIHAAVRIRKKALAEQLGKLALSMDEEVRMQEKKVKVSEADDEEVVEEEDDEEEGEEEEEEDKENDDDEESVEDESSEEEPPRKSAPKKMESGLNLERLVNGSGGMTNNDDGDGDDGHIEEVVKGSPFRVVTRTPAMAATRGRGIDVVDQIGLAATARRAASPKKSSLVFGTFVPSPCNKTFKIKAKRKSSVPAMASPASKRAKK